jgi:hypothetical protein
VTALIVLLTLSFVCAPEARPQRDGSRRPSRRNTTPVRPASVPVPTPRPQATPDASSDPAVVSSAEDVAAQEDEPRQPARRQSAGRARRNTSPEAGEAEAEQLRRSVNKLNEQFTRLSQDMPEIKGEQRTLVDLERLSRAETRAEGLRAQLRDVVDKEFTLQERAAQIEDELDAGAIERRAALTGSLRPADVRDQIRRSLERERERVRTQLEMLASSRVRLESAIASADLEVEKIKERLEAADRQAIEAGANSGGRTGPVPSPNLTNPPPQTVANPSTTTEQQPPPPDDR